MFCEGGKEINLEEKSKIMEIIKGMSAREQQDKLERYRVLNQDVKE